MGEAEYNPRDIVTKAVSSFVKDFVLIVGTQSYLSREEGEGEVAVIRAKRWDRPKEDSLLVSDGRSDIFWVDKMLSSIILGTILGA